MTDTQPSVSARFELPARAASGVVMGVTAIVAVLEGGILFSILIAAGSVAALREWHRLVNAGQLAWEMVPTSLAMIAVVWAGQAANGVRMALIAILCGAAGAAIFAAIRQSRRLWPIPWHAFGALYVGLPTLAFMVLRGLPDGAEIVGSVFVAIWTADTGALFCGRFIGGPKLAPDLSPNKTWAGLLGGTLAAGIAEACYFGVLHGVVVEGFAFGILLALAGHTGDLFESWVKRQFRAKNTGRLIPGHGGMLDRIDSLLFAGPACAIIIILAGFNPFHGAVS